MAISFSNTKGMAQSNKVDSYVYKDGDNVVRLVGGVLPRYVYWVKGSNNKDIPIECLAFNRETEKFDNKDTDYVQKYFPEVKCSWRYVVNCIDPTDGKVKALNLKKKMFEQIITAASDLGDPTDVTTGWPIAFKRVKTGPLAYNVEYQLQVLRCKPCALSAAELAAVAEAQTIDEKYPRQSAEEIKALLEKITSNDSGDADADADAREAINDLGQ
jgi:hypothetical protein